MGVCVHVYRLQVLSGMIFVNIYYNSLQCGPLNPSRLHSPDDVTLENAINLKLKPLLMGSFFKVVKLNCLLQDERSGVENAPGDPDMPLVGVVPCSGMLGCGLDYFVYFV